MKSYRLMPEGFRKVRSRMIIRTCIIGAILSIVVANTGGPRRITPSQILILGIWILAAVLISLFISLKRRRQDWESYRLELTEDSLLRKIAHFPEIAIARQQVRKVCEVRGAGITVRTADPEIFVFIPEALEGYQEVRAQIDHWTQVEEVRRWSVMVLAKVGLAIILGASILLTLNSNRAVVVLPLGILQIVCLPWCAYRIQQSRYIDERFKRWNWLIALPLIAIVVKMAMTIARL